MKTNSFCLLASVQEKLPDIARQSVFEIINNNNNLQTVNETSLDKYIEDYQNTEITKASYEKDGRASPEKSQESPTENASPGGASPVGRKTAVVIKKQSNEEIKRKSHYIEKKILDKLKLDKGFLINNKGVSDVSYPQKKQVNKIEDNLQKKQKNKQSFSKSSENFDKNLKTYVNKYLTKF
jgi:hypothetical protein